jgi:hypothetical protein
MMEKDNLDAGLELPVDSRNLVKNPIKKPSSFLVMVPKIGQLPMVARKIYNAMLHTSQIQIREHVDNNLPINAAHFFTARVTDLSALVTANKSKTIDLAKEYFGAMRRMSVDWRAPDAKSPVIWSDMGLLADVQLRKVNNVLWVDWQYPAKIYEAIERMDPYTKLDLTVISHLSSYAGLALYEICSKYKDNPARLTAQQTPEWWVDALTGSQRKIDKATGLPMPRREWRKFKLASLPTAIKEINTLSDLNIRLIEIKTGKAVTSIQFEVILKATDERPKPNRRITKEILDQAVKSDVPLEAIITLLGQGVSDDVMIFSLKKLQQRIEASHLTAIDNKSAYLRSLIRDAEGLAFSDPEPIVAPPPTQRGSEKPVLSWEDTRRSEVRQEFLALRASEQKPYALAAAERMKSAGIFTTALQRKFNEESWTTGLFLAEAVNQYAISRYGQNWLTS